MASFSNAQCVSHGPCTLFKSAGTVKPWSHGIIHSNSGDNALVKFTLPVSLTLVPFHLDPLTLKSRS